MTSTLVVSRKMKCHAASVLLQPPSNFPLATTTHYDRGKISQDQLFSRKNRLSGNKSGNPGFPLTYG
jgi:hypothetical protein